MRVFNYSVALIVTLFGLGMLLDMNLNSSYESFDYNILPETSMNNIANKHLKEFASQNSECNLTSPFATEEENDMKKRIYDAIIRNQFVDNPDSDCSSKKYWVSSMKWESGLGFKLHIIALEFMRAISENKIFIWGNNYKEWPFIQSPFCKTMECYFKPITNCNLDHINNLNKNKIRYGRIPNQLVSIEMQHFWDPILNITEEAYKEFLTRWKYEYELLVTVSQWFLLRYNIRTKSIVQSNMESVLKQMKLKYNEIIDPNRIISIPVRHSDKCYDETYNNPGAEMLCFESYHIITVIKILQFLYEYQDNVTYGIVNSEDTNVVKDIIQSRNRTFHLLTNLNDIRPETGDPKVWNRNEDVIDNNINHNTLENDYMTSMLTAAQLFTISKYYLFIFNSNWFYYLKHKRVQLKCFPHSLNKETLDVEIELKSLCKRCPVRLPPGIRVAIYKKLKYNVEENSFMRKMLDKFCLRWVQKYYPSADWYEIHCTLTEKF